MPFRETVRLLIVDDEAELREILAEQLATLTMEVADVAYGMTIESASNGREALQLFRKSEFDAVLTDINMPEMTGLELLAALRGEGCHVPSIVLTGFGDKAKAAEALRLGCIGFLEKPWRTDQLRKMVGGALKRGVTQRPLNRKVEERVFGYPGVQETRKRQLRNVFRSILIDDGSHRTDVCAIPVFSSSFHPKPKKTAA